MIVKKNILYFADILIFLCFTSYVGSFIISAFFASKEINIILKVILVALVIIIIAACYIIGSAAQEWELVQDFYASGKHIRIWEIIAVVCMVVFSICISLVFYGIRLEAESIVSVIFAVLMIPVVYAAGRVSQDIITGMLASVFCIVLPVGAISGSEGFIFHYGDGIIESCRRGIDSISNGGIFVNILTRLENITNFSSSFPKLIMCIFFFFSIWSGLFLFVSKRNGGVFLTVFFNLIIVLQVLFDFSGYFYLLIYPAAALTAAMGISFFVHKWIFDEDLEDDGYDDATESSFENFSIVDEENEEKEKRKMAAPVKPATWRESASSSAGETKERMKKPEKSAEEQEQETVKEEEKEQEQKEQEQPKKPKEPRIGQYQQKGELEKPKEEQYPQEEKEEPKEPETKQYPQKEKPEETEIPEIRQYQQKEESEESRIVNNQEEEKEKEIRKPETEELLEKSEVEQQQDWEEDLEDDFDVMGTEHVVLMREVDFTEPDISSSVPQEEDVPAPEESDSAEADTLREVQEKAPIWEEEDTMFDDESRRLDQEEEMLFRPDWQEKEEDNELLYSSGKQDEEEAAFFEELATSAKETERLREQVQQAEEELTELTEKYQRQKTQLKDLIQLLEQAKDRQKRDGEEIAVNRQKISKLESQVKSLNQDIKEKDVLVEEYREQSLKTEKIKDRLAEMKEQNSALQRDMEEQKTTFSKELEAQHKETEKYRRTSEEHRIEAEKYRQAAEESRLRAEQLKEEVESARLEAQTAKAENDRYRDEADNFRRQSEEYRQENVVLLNEIDELKEQLEIAEQNSSKEELELLKAEKEQLDIRYQSKFEELQKEKSELEKRYQEEVQKRKELLRRAKEEINRVRNQASKRNLR